MYASKSAVPAQPEVAIVATNDYANVAERDARLRLEPGTLPTRGIVAVDSVRSAQQEGTVLCFRNSLYDGKRIGQVRLRLYQTV